MKYLIKFTCTLCLLCFCIAKTSAQVEKNRHYNVVIGSFAYNPPAEETPQEAIGKMIKKATRTFMTGQSLMAGKSTTHQPQYAESVCSSIESGFSKVRRLSVTSPMSEADTCDYFIDGVITNITTTTRIEPNADKNKPGTTYYRADIGVGINLKEGKTGKLFDSRQFTISDNAQGWLSSPENAIEHALSSLTSSVASYYNYVFPLKASIIESGEVKKDKQKTAYIDLGRTSRVNEGLRFGVFELKTIAGKEARIEIGQVKIEEVLGDELSLVRVTKGSKEIKAALDKGSTLVISTRY